LPNPPERGTGKMQTDSLAWEQVLGQKET